MEAKNAIENTLTQKSTKVRKDIREQKGAKLKAFIQTVSRFQPKLAVDLALKIFTIPMAHKQRNRYFPDSIKISDQKFAGKKIKFYQYGHSPHKVLLVHGWEGAASDFSRFCELMEKSNLSVITFDLPGHGYSARSSLNTIMASIIIREIIKEYGPVRVIVGHSFGGFSSAYALSQFEELRSTPLITIASPSKLRKVLTGFGDFLGLDRTQKDFAMMRLEQKFKIRMSSFELAKFFNSSEAPKLVIHDEEDNMVSPDSFHEVLRSVDHPIETYLTRGLGHNLILRDEKVINKIIDFVESCEEQKARVQQYHMFGI